jgi:hypothetical protein
MATEMWKVKARPRGKRHSTSQEVKEEENGRGKQVRLARRGYRGRPRSRSWKMGTVGARGSSLAISRAEMPQKRRAKLKVAASASTSSASHSPRVRSSQRGLTALHCAQRELGKMGLFRLVPRTTRVYRLSDHVLTFEQFPVSGYFTTFSSAANLTVSATPVRKEKR